MIYVVNKYHHTPTSRDVYIGRGSPLGNPFTHRPLEKTKARFQCETREESILRYADHLKTIMDNQDVKNELNRIYKLAMTGDVFLVCYCAPQACHGEVIKILIEEVIIIKKTNQT